MKMQQIEVGFEVPPIAKVIYQRALERSFSKDSIHNDEYTKQQGYPGALVSAYVLAGYMSEPMVGFFGPSWFTTGKIALTFIGGGVQQGDHVTCHATVRAIEEIEGGDRHLTLDVWMEKEDGSKAVVGEASGVLPRVPS